MEGSVKTSWGEHIEDDLLEQYALGRLEEPRTTAIEEHLLLCEYCRDRLEEMDSYVVTMGDALHQSEPAGGQIQGSSHPGGGLSPLWAITAAAAAVLGVAYLAPFRQAIIEPIPVHLRSTRGVTSDVSVAVAGAPLELRLDVTGLPDAAAYRVQIVDTAGQVTFTATPRSDSRAVFVNVPPLPAGTYWVRLSDPQGDLVREYALQTGGR